jgi:hypothetical protein
MRSTGLLSFYTTHTILLELCILHSKVPCSTPFHVRKFDNSDGNPKQLERIMPVA